MAETRGRAVEGREARVAMDQALGRVEAANIRISTLLRSELRMSITVSYLGGISKAVETRAQKPRSPVRFALA